jgi:outer membrane protein OmpA-like peptidoglycan-associated protein
MAFAVHHLALGRRAVLLGALLAPAACTPPPQPPRQFDLSADVLFEFGSADLKPQAATALQDILTQIRVGYHNPALRVEGHTDSIGSDAVNDSLSLRRAQSVQQWFVSAGVPPISIQVQGFGKRKPVAPNTTPSGADDPAGRARNRRVDIIVSET